MSMCVSPFPSVSFHIALKYYVGDGMSIAISAGRPNDRHLNLVSFYLIRAPPRYRFVNPNLTNLFLSNVWSNARTLIVLMF